MGADAQHVIYQVEYQKAVKTQIQAILEQLQADEFETVSEYLTKSYEDGFVGTMYSLHNQGMPFIFPIDQAQVVKAIQHDTHLTSSLYTALGLDLAKLKKTISHEISRGIASNMLYPEITGNISRAAGIPLRRARTIVRTEAGRIQEQATMDAAEKAVSKGADLVKQWSAIRDGKTRDTHRSLDGQIREIEEPFEVGGKTAMQPHGFGIASEDCNCRCTTLLRARDALDEEEYERLQDIAGQHGLLVDDSKKYGHNKAKDFADFKKKYLKAQNEDGASYLRGVLPKDYEDTRIVGDPIKPDVLHGIVEMARLKGVQMGMESNPTGGFESYCGDPDVLRSVIEHAGGQLESSLFANSKAKKVILLYDYVTLGGNWIDSEAFAATQGQKITLNKFMYDDSAFLKKKYKESVDDGLFPKGTTYKNVVDHETGHILDKYTKGLRRKVVAVIEREARRDGVSTDEYIKNNISRYAIERDMDGDYKELFAELNSMLQTGERYGIIEVLRKEGVI